jgi:serine O-acetyltransferase
VNASNTEQRAAGGRTRDPNEIRARHPEFLKALLADARVATAFRGERHQFRSRLDGVLQALRLMLQTDAFLGLAAYRAKARLQALGIPVLPWIAHHIALRTADISIADSVVVHPGVFIPNGRVVIYGIAEVHQTATLLPWVTIAPVGGGVEAPTIGRGAQIGSGAKLLGAIEVGANARVGTNAVLLDDVPPNTTVVGMPARPVSD